MSVMLNFIIFIVIAGVVVGAVFFLRDIYFKLKLNAIRNIEYKREFSVAGAFEDEEIYMIETVYNRGIIPAFFVDIEFYLYSNLNIIDSEHVYRRSRDSAMQLVASRFNLFPYMKIVRHHKVKCLRRGFYKLETAGIFYKNNPIFIKSIVDLYVYPKIIDIKYDSKPFNIFQGNVLSLSRIVTDPFSISGIRDYQTGDPFNLINFKATSKYSFNQNLKVNKLDYGSSRMFMIFINFQIPSDITISTKIYENLMERALSFAASFINEALRNGYKIGLSANCTMISGESKIYFPQVSGLYHVEEILKEISKVQLKSGVSFSSLLFDAIANNICDSEIFIMTMFADAAAEENINMLKRLNNTVNIIELE